MSKRRQKGTRNHRSLNLFEKGWLSADVGFTIVKRSILKIKDPNINIKNTIQQTKTFFEIGMQKYEKTNQKGPQTGSEREPKA